MGQNLADCKWFEVECSWVTRLPYTFCFVCFFFWQYFPLLLNTFFYHKILIWVMGHMKKYKIETKLRRYSLLLWDWGLSFHATDPMWRVYNRLCSSCHNDYYSALHLKHSPHNNRYVSFFPYWFKNLHKQEKKSCDVIVFVCTERIFQWYIGGMLSFLL